MSESGTGPLSGVRVLEMAGIGPAPFAGMVLSDFGADVLRIDRAPEGPVGSASPHDVLGRGRRSAGIDLKHPDGAALVLELSGRADALIEGFRPGVMERLGLGPDVCCAQNPRLVYGRMTGWGQDGPLAQAAGHDINYISLAGALHPIGRAGGPPVPPLNLVGDFGGGGMLLALGVVSALFESQRSGAGQVVDAAMVDGAALLNGAIYGARQADFWSDERGENLLDSGAHFYDAYETSDGKYVAIGSIEPQFYSELMRRLELEQADFEPQNARERWPEWKERFRALFLTKTRDEWCDVLEGTDVCFAPVLSMAEVHTHPHIRARGTFVDVEGARQPAPAPRFGRTEARIAGVGAGAGEHTDRALVDWGISPDEVSRLREIKAIA